ncbi:MAG: hypothetical protein O2921_11100 [Chloroflexi bacterium]|nr:hypothetical protein [Chloroflexota bacterium]
MKDEATVGRVELTRMTVSCPFIQTKLLNTVDFAKYARDRGVHLRWQTIHRLAMSGVLSPVAVTDQQVADKDPGRFIALTDDQQTYFADSWPHKDFDLGDPAEPSMEDGRGMLWHPLQIWALDQVVKRLSLSIAGEASLYGIDKYLSLVKRIWDLRPPEEAVHALATNEMHRQLPAVVALWVFAEAIFIGTVDGRIKLRAIPGDQTLSDYLSWKEKGDWQTLVDRVGLTPVGLARWHNNLSVEAALQDPMRQWRTLLRYAPRTQRSRTAGVALFAEDFYYFAEVIRRYLTKYHGMADLPEEDDALHRDQGPVVKERLYGRRVTTDFDRTVFRQVVRQYHLDPQPRFRWLVEGDTEIGYIKRTAETHAVDLEQAGVELINLHGLGGIDSDRTRTLLEMSRLEEVFAYISLDHDGIKKNPGILVHYAKQGLLPAGFQVFEPDFESENFTVAEIADAANHQAELEGSNDVKFTTEEIQKRQQAKGIPIGKAIETLASSKRLKVAKGEAWGAALADIAGKDAVELRDSHRPISQAFARTLQANDSSYLATVTRTRVTETGELVEGS